VGPLNQEGRLAVTGRGSDADHAAIACAGRLDELGATHETWPNLRDRKLGVEQRLIECTSRPRRLGRILGHDEFLGKAVTPLSGESAGLAMRPPPGRAKTVQAQRRFKPGAGTLRRQGSESTTAAAVIVLGLPA
jgi:hypothetical protein